MYHRPGGAVQMYRRKTPNVVQDDSTSRGGMQHQLATPKGEITIRQWGPGDKEDDLKKLPSCEMAGGNDDIQKALDDIHDVRLTLWSDQGCKMTDNDMGNFTVRRCRFLYLAFKGEQLAAFVPVRVLDNYATLVRKGAIYNKHLLSKTEFYLDVVEQVRLSVWNKEPHLTRAPYLEKETFISFEFPFPKDTLPYGPPTLKRRVQCFTHTLTTLASVGRDTRLEKLTEEVSHVQLFRLVFNAELNNKIFLNGRPLPKDGYPRIVVGWQPLRWGKTNLQQSSDLHSSNVALCVRDFLHRELWSNKLKFLVFGTARTCRIGVCYVVQIYGDVLSHENALESVLYRHLRCAKIKLDEEAYRTNNNSLCLEFQVVYDATEPKSLTSAITSAMATYNSVKSPHADVFKRMFVWERSISEDLDLSKTVQDYTPAPSRRRQKTGRTPRDGSQY